MQLTIKQRLNILYALACADALGAFAEFKDSKTLKRRHPQGVSTYLPGSPFGFLPGEATDDTQMALATIVGLLKGGAPSPMAVADAYVRWYASSPPDVGAQTGGALSKIGQTRRLDSVMTLADSSDKLEMHRRGNGGLMRVAAVTVAGLAGDEAVKWAAITTAITHPSPVNVLASAFLVRLLEHLATRGDNFQAAVSAARAEIVGNDSRLRTVMAAGLVPQIWLMTPADALNALERACKLVGDAISRGSDGYLGNPVGETLGTLQAAIAHNVQGTDWLSVASAAALEGGDSDTIACVAGAIAGARGWEAPEHLLDALRIGATWEDWTGVMTPADGGFAALLRGDQA